MLLRSKSTVTAGALRGKKRMITKEDTTTFYAFQKTTN